ncbi:vgr related protein [Novosphingobium sp. FSY-8]|uniref:Vgr related protein n=1 Tax=Novosphingobium ovatum TaxID=1908523 RepID=A0ABW9XCQ6_9SPHN|nr:vgr related protein [Novosphingobium ovatum]NBC36277.1 vgr related protein [Novosphingobium ovatum]
MLAASTPAGGQRPLSPGERVLTHAVFGTAVAVEQVRLRRRRFLPFQPAATVMAPNGHLYFPPACPLWHEDFAAAPLPLQGLFVHEMVHVWQTQTHGRWYLPLRRMPWCRYDYRLTPGQPFAAYNVEQQAEIIRHLFLARHGAGPMTTADQALAQAIVPFRGA